MRSFRELSRQFPKWRVSEAFCYISRHYRAFHKVPEGLRGVSHALQLVTRGFRIASIRFKAFQNVAGGVQGVTHSFSGQLHVVLGRISEAFQGVPIRFKAFLMISEEL